MTDKASKSGWADHYAKHPDIFFDVVEMSPVPMLLTDPAQEDNPIIFANHAFITMAGYSRLEIMGRNCRFLQGPMTDPATLAQMRAAIAARAVFTDEILNYRKDGSTFWNALFISPVFTANDELAYFFSSQLNVSRRHDAEHALARTQKRK